MPAGVHVDGYQRFGFIHDDVTAALEMDLAREGVLQLARDVEAIEDRLRFGVELHLLGGAFGDLGNHFAHALVGFLAVHDDAFDVFREEIADGAFDQVGLLENAGGRRLGFDAILDQLPFFEQQREVANEIAHLLAFANGAHDDAHAIGNGELAQNLFSSAGVPAGFRFCAKCRFDPSSAAARGNGRATRGWW